MVLHVHVSRTLMKIRCKYLRERSIVTHTHARTHAQTHTHTHTIGVAPITQKTHVRNKNSNTLGSKSEFLHHKELLLKERIRSLWEQIPFKRTSHFERDVIVENHYLIQWSPFVVRDISRYPLHTQCMDFERFYIQNVLFPV